MILEEGGINNQVMIMEGTNSNNNNKEVASSQVMKGKRTKRPRPASPLTLGANCTSSSGDHHHHHHNQSPERLVQLGGGGDYYNNNNNVNNLTTLLLSSSSPSTSVDQLSEAAVDQVGEEEEDMANCLILLAQGGRNNDNLSHKAPQGISLVKSNNSSSGLEVYQCKTCNRCFPSFQALGGHRASHKKPKTAEEAVKKRPLLLINKADDVHRHQNHHQHHRHHQAKSDETNTTLSLQIPSSGTSHHGAVAKPSKVHECSICGAEFSSGQALGGHMRRHRPFPSPTSNNRPFPSPTSNTTTTTTTTATNLGKSSSPEESQELKKARTSPSLELDLNLPAAPEDDLAGRDPSKFHFATKEQVIVFSSSPLVDCHY